MLDNANITSASVSEAVEKIPTDEKDYRKCSFMALYFTKSRPIYIRVNSRNSCLPTRILPVRLKKSQKKCYIKFTQKRCNYRHMISFIHFRNENRVYRFPSDNKLADLREGGG